MAYYLHLHFLKSSELAAAEAQELTELAALLPTLTLEYTCTTIVLMWSDLWLAYQLAPVRPFNEQGHFTPCYRGRVHYLVPLMNVSLHIPSSDTFWALPFRYQLRPGKGSLLERHKENHDYLPLERFDQPVAQPDNLPLDGRVQQEYNDFLKCCHLLTET